MKLLLKFDFNQLEKGPLRFEGKADAAMFDISSDAIVSFGEISYSICISPICGGAISNADIIVNTIRRCGICLEEFNDVITLKGVTHFYEKNIAQEFDLIPDLRDDILLACPLNLKCKKDCKGLCPDCGANLNKEKCSCSRKNKTPVNTEWQELDKLQIKKNKRGSSYGNAKKKKI